MRFRVRLTVGALALAIAPALLLVPAWLSAQSALISGRVTSETGAGVAGASVLIEGLSVGSITDEQGRYTLSVPSARVQGQTVRLTARRLGYSARTVQIALTPGPITQSFVLGANPLQLGEIVVTGAGTSTSVEKLGNVRNCRVPRVDLRSRTNRISSRRSRGRRRT